MTNDRPFFGMILMLGFCILAPAGDAVAKLLGDTVPLGVLLFTRFILQVLLLAPLVFLNRQKSGFAPGIFPLVLIRTLLHIFGIGAMFLSLRYLPLADAVAIAFVMPLIMLLLGKTFLNETVGFHRLVACAAGFLGTLLVIQPNFADVGAPAMLPLFVAVDFALFMLVTRKIAKNIDPIFLQFSSGIMACGILLAMLILFQGDWPITGEVLPSSADFGLLFLLGALGTIAHLLMTWSLRFAPAATLAPMQYLEIPVATFVGWMVFHDLPNGLAALGIAITIAAGLYIIWRERFIAQQAR